MEKLIKIQSELKAPKNQFNNFGKYKYRSLEDILEALKPILGKHNCTLVLNDETKEIAGNLLIEVTATLIDCDSKETLKVNSCAGIDINKKGMDFAQCYGSSSSYARKYALNGLFLIDDTKDSDGVNDHDKNGKPELKPSHQKWSGAVKALKDGTVTIDKIKDKYVLSPDDENKLLDEAI